jgi:hypothetical protein
MSPFEERYGRKCNTLVSWDNPTYREVVGPYLLRELEEKMLKIKQNLKSSQDRKKRCVDKGRTHREFNVGDHVFLKVKANRSSLKFGNCSKLVVGYGGLFEIPERIGPITYIIEFPKFMSIHNVFHVSLLKKYIPNANHVIDWKVIQVEQDDAIEVHLVHILDRKIK